MKIAFINPNLSSDYPRPPLGLLSLVTVCKEQGYQVEIIDANLDNLSVDSTAQRAANADVVALTAMTPTINEAYKIADKLSDKTIFLGGVHASVFPAECARTGYFDSVFQGEGELSILQALKDLELGRLKPVYLSNNPQFLDDIPLPDYSLIQVQRYKARYPHSVKPPWTTASTSRGCPYDCQFCCKAVSGKEFRPLSTDRMINLVNELKVKHKINDITFYDDIFTLNKARVFDFCAGLTHFGIGISWTCESRVESADPELFKQMKAAGCRLIYFGIESGNQRILDRLNKRTTLAQIKEAIHITQDAGIQAAGYFMLGCPGETTETICETIRFAEDLKLNHAQFSVCSPLPGSKLYTDYLNAGYVIPDWSNFKYLADCDKPMFTSKDLSGQQIEQAVKLANDLFKRES